MHDDGVGAGPAALNDPQSWGVIGMRERAKHFGGRLTIDSAPGHGRRLRLTIPIEQVEQTESIKPITPPVDTPLSKS